VVENRRLVAKNMTTESASTIQSIGQIAINAKDVARAKVFYRDVLGLPHLFDAGPKLSFFRCGDVRLMITTPEKPEFDHPASIIYYKVADLNATCDGLAAKGITFEQKPTLVAPMPDHDLWMAFMRDSEGNMVGLMAEVPRPTAPN
jgi:methylmalonyl-CoA/ethylmalonyl-CoA epimerase